MGGGYDEVVVYENELGCGENDSVPQRICVDGSDGEVQGSGDCGCGGDDFVE